jgi:hypothetical protein
MAEMKDVENTVGENNLLFAASQFPDKVFYPVRFPGHDDFGVRFHETKVS